jgi:hypothetical protein
MAEHFSPSHDRPSQVCTIDAAARDEGIWLLSFTHSDVEYFDLRQKTLRPLDSPFGTRLSPMS